MRCDAGPANNKRGPIRDPRARRYAYMQAGVQGIAACCSTHWLSLGRQECHVGVVGGDVASSRVQRHGQLFVGFLPSYAGRAVGARGTLMLVHVHLPLTSVSVLFVYGCICIVQADRTYKNNLPSSVHSHSKFHVPEPPESHVAKQTEVCHILYLIALYTDLNDIRSISTWLV